MKFANKREVKELAKRATVSFDWDHPNCKFFPGDMAKVKNHIKFESNKAKCYCGEKGVVLAVTIGNSPCIRGSGPYDVSRGTTYYYLLMPTGEIRGFRSHNLSLVQ